MRLIESESDKMKQLQDFAKEVIRVAFEGGSLDGGDIQEMGVKHGLLTEERYDPLKHASEVSWEWDFEPGDTIYMFTEVLNLPKAIEPTASPSEAAADQERSLNP